MVVEFVDLECPFCAQHHEVVEQHLNRDSSGITFRFAHFPLSMHRFATPAARAAECAAAAGRFFEFVAVVMRGRDSLGLKSWGQYAAAAGIQDTAAVGRCAREGGTVARIERGLALGRRAGVGSTPTVVIDGKRLVPTPTDGELSAILDSLAMRARRRGGTR